MPPTGGCVCGGSGKCVQCAGTGINAHLNEREPKCHNCAGTGICPICEGNRAFTLLDLSED